MISFDNLPKAVLFNIANKLENKDANSLARTNKTINNKLMSNGVLSQIHCKNFGIDLKPLSANWADIENKIKNYLSRSKILESNLTILPGEVKWEEIDSSEVLCHKTQSYANTRLFIDGNSKIYKEDENIYLIGTCGWNPQKKAEECFFHFKKNIKGEMELQGLILEPLCFPRFMCIMKEAKLGILASSHCSMITRFVVVNLEKYQVECNFPYNTSDIDDLRTNGSTFFVHNAENSKQKSVWTKAIFFSKNREVSSLKELTTPKKETCVLF